MHGADQFDRLGVFDQKTAGASTNRLGDILVELERGDHHDPRARQYRIRDDLFGRPEPVAVRHPDVHQNNVRAFACHEGDRLAAGGGLANDLKIRLGLEQAAETRTDQLLVIGDRHADRHGVASWLTCSGSSATTRNPPPSAGPALR